ncbi:unnamed protein product, partial [Urochloa humidicola]
MGSSEAPLLLPHTAAGKEEDAEVEVRPERCCWWRCGASEGRWAEATAEAGRLASLAAPMIAVALLQLMMQLISTVMVGHLGEVPLAGAAIANSLTNVSGFSVLISVHVSSWLWSRRSREASKSIQKPRPKVERAQGLDNTNSVQQRQAP